MLPVRLRSPYASSDVLIRCPRYSVNVVGVKGGVVIFFNGIRDTTAGLIPRVGPDLLARTTQIAVDARIYGPAGTITIIWPKAAIDLEAVRVPPDVQAILRAYHPGAQQQIRAYTVNGWPGEEHSFTIRREDGVITETYDYPEGEPSHRAWGMYGITAILQSDRRAHMNEVKSSTTQNVWADAVNGCIAIFMFGDPQITCVYFTQERASWWVLVEAIHKAKEENEGIRVGKIVIIHCGYDEYFVPGWEENISKVYDGYESEIMDEIQARLSQEFPGAEQVVKEYTCYGSADWNLPPRAYFFEASRERRSIKQYRVGLRGFGGFNTNRERLIEEDPV